MNNLLLLADFDACTNVMPLIRVIKHGIMPLIQLGIPIVLILMGTIDLGKAVIASDDKEIKAATGRLIKRVLYAVVIFFMVSIVSLVVNLITTAQNDDVPDSDWRNCWSQA